MRGWRECLLFLIFNAAVAGGLQVCFLCACPVPRSKQARTQVDTCTCRPLFPGKDYVDQLKLIVKTLGPPSEEDLTFINSHKARAYIRALPPVEVRLDLAGGAHLCWMGLLHLCRKGRGECGHQGIRHCLPFHSYGWALDPWMLDPWMGS